jgi:hypothetical protein
MFGQTNVLYTVKTDYDTYADLGESEALTRIRMARRGPIIVEPQLPEQDFLVFYGGGEGVMRTPIWMGWNQSETSRAKTHREAIVKRL